jgi:hypothetical protein
MIVLKRVLAPVDDTSFCDICSFETESYIGIYTDSKGFILMTKDDKEFQLVVLGSAKSLEELDEMCYNKGEEHIDSVSTSRHISVNIVED